MAIFPHSNYPQKSVNCAVITVSDSRTLDTDKSGKLAQELLVIAGHKIIYYEIIKDDVNQLQLTLENLANNSLVECAIFSGGTGIAPRDNSFDVISKILDKTLFGFGEIFRYLSYQEIGSRAIASRSIAGTYQSKLIFSLPGSQNAVKLALEKLWLLKFLSPKR